MKDKIPIPYDYIHSLRLLTDKEAGRLFKNVLCYAKGKPYNNDDRILDIMFTFLKKGIDDYNKKNHYGYKNLNLKNEKTKQNIAIRNGVDVRSWRKNVFERDNYTCQMCNTVGKGLHAHHIKHFSKYPDLRTDIDNGVTLCKTCHRHVHSKEYING